MTATAMAAALAGCLPTESPAPSATFRSSNVTLAQFGTLTINATVIDRTGLVTKVEVVPELDVLRLTDADYLAFKKQGFVVRQVPGDDRALFFDWGYGSCDATQTLTFDLAAPGQLAVAIDPGPSARSECDLALRSSEVRVTFSQATRAQGVVGTMAPRP